MTFTTIFLALTLRLIGINQSLWLDESIQALALMGRMGPILDYALNDFQPPLYHLLGILWTRIGGYSEFSLRFISLVAGLGLVYYVIKFAHELGGKKLGHIAGLLAATNPLLIYYSQEGRTYATTAFLVTASFYYLYLLINKKYLKSNAFYFVLFTTLALWSSYIAWIVIGLQLLYVLSLKRYQLSMMLVAAFSTLVLWLPSLLDSLLIGLSTAAHSPAWGKVVGGLSVKAVALTWVKAVIGRISFDSHILYGLVVVILGILHGRVLISIKKPHRLLLVWVASIMPIILVSFFVPVYSYFRLLFIVPAYLIFLAVGLATLPLRWSYVLIMLQLVFSVIYFRGDSFHREDWRQVVSDYGQDATYALPSVNQNAPLLYYGVPREQIIEPKTNLPLIDDRIIYIKYVEDVFDLGGKGPASLRDSGYTITKSQVYSGLQVDVYENSN